MESAKSVTGETDDYAFIAFKHRTGNTLAALIAHGHTAAWPVEEGQANLCGNLRAARQARVTYLSIAPSTLWVADPDHLISIVSLDVPGVHATLDSALSRDADSEDDERGYIAPECLEGHRRDEVADVYATAAVLFELLPPGMTGLLKSAEESELFAILQRALSIRREERYQDWPHLLKR